MPQVRGSKSPKGEVCAGLRILAKIIAREVVHQQLAKIDLPAADSASLDPLLAEVSDYVEGSPTEERRWL
jgi:hypothetical protein